MKSFKNMEFNYGMLLPRMVDSFDYLDSEHARKTLERMTHGVACFATGGSYAAGLFASQVIERKNKSLTKMLDVRDGFYFGVFDLPVYNYLGVSYSGSYFVKLLETRFLECKMEGCLLTSRSDSLEDISYGGRVIDERSFISLASTLLPMNVLLNYYMGSDKASTLKKVRELHDKAVSKASSFSFSGKEEIIEIMSGDNTYVASKVLESSIVEAGLGVPVVHEKYSFCHGRSTLPNRNRSNTLIYLINQETDIDKMLLSMASYLYENIIVLESSEKDYIVGEYDLAMQAFFLLRELAIKKDIDLSKVEYSEVVKLLYTYKGDM